MLENIAAEDFATGDDALITTSSTLTDEEILQEATQAENKGRRSRMMTKNW